MRSVSHWNHSSAGRHEGDARDPRRAAPAIC